MRATRGAAGRRTGGIGAWRVLRRAALAAAVLSWAGLAGGGRPVWAWGRLAHRASARFAESRLTPAARAAVRDLLEPGESLADASTWADEVRRDRPESGPWHYVNVPLTQDRYDPKFCPPGGCVVSKVGDFRRVLADRNAPREKRREALRFLVHFVQDLHQPVHVGERGDRGGNDLQVRFFGDGSNLHRVWDSGLIERVYRDEARLSGDLEMLAADPGAASWAAGPVTAWADESLAAAKTAYVNPVNKTPLRRGARLDQPYQDANLPVAQRRLAQSAVRLAALLNETLGDTPAE